MKALLAKYMAKERLRKPHEKILLAASGGMDSTVLAHLLKGLHLPFALAHVNYSLRGSASDGDAQFVTDLANQLDVPVFQTTQPLHLVKEAGESIQMAARRVRYAWLEQVAQAEGYQKIATAHQADDNAETLFLHLIRGTGIHGLHGILPKRDPYIRPLLFATREDIAAFAKANDISYREDASNQRDDYLRNQIRHHIIPRLQDMNPSLIATMQQNIAWWRHAETLYEERMEFYRKRLLISRHNEIFIPLRRLMTYAQPEVLLGALLRDSGFNSTQLEQLLDKDTQPGARVESDTHRLYKRARFLILSPLQSADATWIEVYAKPKQTIRLPGGQMTIRIQPWTSGQPIPGAAHVAMLDADTIKWPLVFRRWKAGDYFYPLGLTRKKSNKIGKKKLSDLFTDLKLTPTEKEAAWVVTSGEHIVWVAPYRIDDRHKITQHTREVLMMSWSAEKRQ